MASTLKKYEITIERVTTATITIVATNKDKARAEALRKAKDGDFENHFNNPEDTIIEIEQN